MYGVSTSTVVGAAPANAKKIASAKLSPSAMSSFDAPASAPKSASRISEYAIPHSSVLVARPATGVFSAHVRHRLNGQYSVVMDSRKVSLDTPLQDHNSVLCAPIRQIFESEGGMLEWSATNHTVKAVTPTKEVDLKIGSKKATVNDKEMSLSTAPYIKGNRTMIPVGFLPKALNVNVVFDPATGHLEINSKN